MNHNNGPGLGELLRHLLELVDGSSDSWYQGLGFDYRSRYTPLMRMLKNGPATVSELQEQLSVTQGAVSQTIKLMLKDGLIEKRKGEDSRQSIIDLSTHGHAALEELEPHWEGIFCAIEAIENEIHLPLMKSLTRSVEALGKKSFAERTTEAKEISRTTRVAENHFEDGGEAYAAFRPSYPPELANALANLVNRTDVVVDVGCGTGQLTALLTTEFDKVIGIDPSKDMLAQTTETTNLAYSRASAESLGLEQRSVDLFVAAQAAHWFDLDQFYIEVQRAAKPGAAIALVSYGVPYVAHGVNAVFQKGYWVDLHEFWPPERKYVETGYAEIPFPFEPIEFPALSIRKEMSFDEFTGYVKTWSAYKNAMRDGAAGRFIDFLEQLKTAWPSNERLEVAWPISVRAGRITP